MEKKYNNKESRGLPGGPNEVFSYVTGVFSTDGYRSDSQDVNNPFNVIPSGNITMKERDGRPLRKGPLLGVDNLGNKKIMRPGQDYQFPGDEVTEIPMAQDGKTLSMEDQVYSRFPALRNMGEVTFKADPEFTREATGVGDIEYFGPGEDRTQITYPNNFVYKHPKVGTHGIVYNPETNNAQAIALDMLHGLGKDDKNYEKLRNEFGESYMNSIFREDFERDVKMFKEEIGEDKFNEWYDDDKDYFNQSYVDGIIRNLLFEGSPEDFKESRYWEGAREGYLSQPGLKETFNALEGYLKTPTKKHGGQLPMHFKKNNSRKQNKTHLIKMLGLREFTGR